MMLVACRQLLTLWRTPVERVGMSAATILLIFGIGCAGHYGAKFAAPQLCFLLPDDLAPAIRHQSDTFISS